MESFLNLCDNCLSFCLGTFGVVLGLILLPTVVLGALVILLVLALIGLITSPFRAPKK